jgi:hypothetical protein
MNNIANKDLRISLSFCISRNLGYVQKLTIFTFLWSMTITFLENNKPAQQNLAY